MHFKVCSCPKRDMNKETKPIMPSKKREAMSAPQGKHPSKMLCMGQPQQLVKTEPITPPSPLTSDAPSPMSQVQRDRTVAVTILLPNRDAAGHVLRCAYNEVTAQMTKDKQNVEAYIGYAQNIQKQIGNFYLFSILIL